MSATDAFSPIDTVQKAQDAFEKGPITAVAAFFAVAFFTAILYLLRTKDNARTEQLNLQLTHAKQLADGETRHSEEIAGLYQEEKERAVKHEVTMSRFLDMMEDVRFIAFEMRRVRLLRERKKKDESDSSESE